MSGSGEDRGARESEVPAGERLLRLFWALDLPGPTLDLVEGWQRSQGASRATLRAVPRDSLHVTLAFLGERPERDLEAISAAAQGLGSGPVPAAFDGLPRPIGARPPRLFALRVESSAAERLQAELAARLVAIGAYADPREPDRRPFWPHLTVFRVRRGRPGSGDAPASHRLGPLPVGERGGHAFGFVRVSLYLSETRPEGASYSRLAANELPQQGGRQKR